MMPELMEKTALLEKSARKKFSPEADFPSRHCGLSESDTKIMLKQLEVASLEKLGEKIIPTNIYSDNAPDLGDALNEHEALAQLRVFARKNKPAISMIGLGYYGTEVPPVVLRKLLENPAWYTAYTPYQAEISQGRLEMLLNFQTMISDLTGLPMANASLLDEATAAAEAMTLLHRMQKKKTAYQCLVDENLFFQTLDVLKTRAEALEIKLIITATENFTKNLNQTEDIFGALIGYPSGDGKIQEHTKLISTLKEKGVAAACVTDLLALMLLQPPATMGFDIAVGSSQRFGVPMGFGGPHAAFISFRENYARYVPGRIVGVSKDKKNRVGYRLALQAREQHIRREKATSNICTAQALPAMVAVAYAIYQGPRRLKAIAKRANALAEILAQGLLQLGFSVKNACFFDTIRVLVPENQAARIVKEVYNKSCINLFLESDGVVGISTDEMTLPEHIEAIWDVFAKVHSYTGKSDSTKLDSAKLDFAKLDFAKLDFEAISKKTKPSIPENLKRKSEPLLNEVFRLFHTEHEMLRYLRRMADKDISLNRSMIALGSCTMKLNATTEMIPITWNEFANVHPFAPVEQVQGYLEVLGDFSRLLATVTGFHSVSLQPNAGSQGEFAGLLTIRRFLKSKGENKRNICLIPASSHGTNPASAVMAGMKVVPVEIDSSGQVSLEDLILKTETHKENLAALMITYPSTCGVFGSQITKLCEIVHQAGGQVYMDGANLNAMVGLTYPGKFGPDVMHINLHKTFCIPHGGGGPGMGPIAVAEHLADFLPNHSVHSLNNEPKNSEPIKKGSGAISATPFGSSMILLISWLYIRMMGGAGLRKATLNALLSANYIASSLKDKFPLLYCSKAGFVAHECILDTRGFKKTTNVTVEDIAKRLMDFGYHAPTISWPIAGTMMIEPTESEAKVELDCFCSAMLSIYKEIQKIKKGEWTKEDNPLHNAPHIAEDIIVDNWEHSYSRSEAVFPTKEVLGDKYWPPIGRIDAAFGDRNLISTRPEPENKC